MSSPTDNLLSSDPGRSLLEGLVKVMAAKINRASLPSFIMDEEGKPVKNPEYVDLGAAEMSAILNLLRDSSVTLANIRRGDFGETVKRAAEEFPFPHVIAGGKA